MDLTKVPRGTKQKTDLTKPIARMGEPIYASIIRNRSGMDSGSIDMGVRVLEIEELCDADKQAICNTAFALYESVCRHTGKKVDR